MAAWAILVARTAAARGSRERIGRCGGSDRAHFARHAHAIASDAGHAGTASHRVRVLGVGGLEHCAVARGAGRRPDLRQAVVPRLGQTLQLQAPSLTAEEKQKIFYQFIDK